MGAAGGRAARQEEPDTREREATPLSPLFSPSHPPTERQLREQLDAKFGCELSDRKALIRAEVREREREKEGWK